MSKATGTRAKQKVSVPETSQNAVEDIEEGLATAFARAYVDEGNNALKACMQIWPGDVDKALRMSALLANHPDVKIAIADAQENALNTLPTKAEYARKLWTMTDTAESDDGKYKFMKLYAEIRGFIEKPAAPVHNVTTEVILPRCIEVPSYGSDSDWEERTVREQAELMKRAKGRG